MIPTIARAQKENLVKHLNDSLIGQPHVIDQIVPALTRQFVNLAPSTRPIGAFLLAGPTGVGKTHTAEQIAYALHGFASHYLRVDCGEYQRDHEIARLIGAPPGYLGHKETKAILSNTAVQKYASNPTKIAVILFDEIEKAAPAFNDVLLGILDKGVLSLGDGTNTQFANTLILMTTNIGSRSVTDTLTGGYGLSKAADVAADKTNVRGSVVAAAKRHFRPEFLNRLTDVIVYNPLDVDATRKILDRELDAVQSLLLQRLGSAAPYINFSEESKRFLLENGVSNIYGARELIRTIDKYIVNPVSDWLLDWAAPGNTNPPDLNATVNVDKTGLEFSFSEPAKKRSKKSVSAS